ncbi:alpha/beta fold hydrolase [Cryomorphaceae bacterium 1068]|nr:alpha/beta fold hydrolase [Cryomorphaceae bacterium 1068]
MKRIYMILAILAALISFNSAKAQELVSAELVFNYNTALISFLGFPLPVEYAVDFYRITYTTTDTDGEPTIASGAFTLPVSGSCNSFPMVAYCHGTVLKRYDVPSERNFESLVVTVLSSAGYIGIAPDYLGLGVDEGVHPYVHAESQATATIDLISAVREFLGTSDMQDNGEVFITGYSQGGHASMAALKYAQENDLVDELGIVAGAPLSGPYNMSGSQSEVILSGEPYSNPGYIIYLLVGYNSVYGNLYTELSDIVQEPYADLVAPYFDGEQDEFEMTVVNALLPGNIDELLRDSVLTNFETNPNHPLRVALEDNDLFDWSPEMPLRMFYCDGDEQVAFTNSTTTDQIMNDNGAEDVASENVLPGANHGGCVEPALFATYEFFDGLASGCSSTLSVTDAAEESIAIWPNPARDVVQIIFALGSGQMALYDVNGRLLKEQIVNSELSTFDVSDLPNGNYILTITHNGAQYGTLLVVKK